MEEKSLKVRTKDGFVKEYDLSSMTNQELENLYTQTKKDRSKYNNEQINKKVQLNSCFGAVGNIYFRFFDIRLAEAITLSGQLSAKWIGRKLNEFFNNLLESEGKDYVLASDTDSVYIDMAAFVDRMYRGRERPKTGLIVDALDKVCREKITEFIDKSYKELADQQNAFQQKMIMKREVIADKGIWRAKKRYVLNVHDSEGTRYSKPKMKIVGLEVVRSSTPMICREAIKNCLDIMLNDDNERLIEYIAEFKRSWDELPVQDIGRPTGLNQIDKYSDAKSIYGFKTPIHVKGSLLYNHWLEEKGIATKYEKLHDGDKIKYVYLIEPNPIHNEVISVLNILPDEFDLKGYIDYDRQFDKAFIEPVKAITDSIGWTTVEISNLDVFF